jgi:hypothetical protein
MMAISFPIPLAAPVTMATLSFKRIGEAPFREDLSAVWRMPCFALHFPSLHAPSGNDCEATATQSAQLSTIFPLPEVECPNAFESVGALQDLWMTQRANSIVVSRLPVFFHGSARELEVFGTTFIFFFLSGCWVTLIIRRGSCRRLAN